jgi:hypothetical protein
VSGSITISSRLGVENGNLGTNDLVRGISVDQWGVDAEGNAYFSPAGAVPGSDRVFLSLDANGMPVLRRPAVREWNTVTGWLAPMPSDRAGG